MSTAQPPIVQFPQAPADPDEVKPGSGQIDPGQIEWPDAEGAEREFPGYIELGALRHPDLRVVEPIRVSLAIEDGGARAHAEEIDEFGFGASYVEALVDLQQTIAELYFTLEEERERLGPDLARVWSALQIKILRRNATEAA